MQRVIATTKDTVEELADWANEAAAAGGGEVTSVQVIKMEDLEGDVFFAAVALIDVAEVVPAEPDSEFDRAKQLRDRATEQGW